MLKYHIQTIELASASKAIVFSSVPASFDDLLVVFSTRSDRAGNVDDPIYYNFNGNSANYSARTLIGSGSGGYTESHNTTAGFVGYGPAAATTANTFANGSLYISNYTSSAFKSTSVDFVGENNATTIYQHITAGLWSNTSVINSIALSAGISNLVAGSSASLYGIKRGTDGVTNGVATGGTVTTSGGFTYHTFTSSGTFTANRTLNADVLVVAGGAGSGYGDNSGGGGAGGYLEGSITIPQGSYAATVGAGGTTPYPGFGLGTNGANSSFMGATAIGGGRSGATGDLNGAPGGSGGANGYNGSTYGTGGAGRQLNSGGLTGYGTDGQGGVLGGRGGGAGQSGAAGGAGRTWLNGSTYGRGGGVAGSTPGVTQPANSGNGADQGGTGGSGIVIIRYPTPA